MNNWHWDLATLTWQVLRTRAEEKSGLTENGKRLIRDFYQVSLQEMYALYEEFNRDSDLLAYFLAVLTIKAASKAPIGAQEGLMIAVKVKEFVDWTPEWGEIIMRTYAGGLIKEISAAESHELRQWGEVILSFNECAGTNSVKMALDMRFINDCVGLLDSLKDFTTEKSRNLIRLVRDGRECGVRFEDTAVICIERILDKVIEKNDLNGIKKYFNGEVVVQYEEIRSIVMEVEGLGVNENSINKKLKLMKNACYNKSIPFEPLCLVEIDIDSIKFTPKPIYSSSANPNFTIEVLKGETPEGLTVIKKVYKYFADEFNFKMIDHEIAILTFLSNRALPTNCYLKLYAVEKTRETISLYMESGGENLMNVLTHWKKNNTRKEKEFMEQWVIVLLNCYAELSTVNIFHCDIKPHNILVGQENQLKIIDFNISQRFEEAEGSIIPTNEFPIQGTKGYLAPELMEFMNNHQRTGKYSPEKSDVYSLGLTILQMLTYEDMQLYSRKELYESLISKIHSVDAAEWVRSLLKGMLKENRKERLRFRQCLSYIPIDNHSAVTLTI
jgi:serine/threonine protein kinase